jgi:hypothetical protein
MLRIVVSTQMKFSKTRDLGDLFNEPLPTNGLIHGASLSALLQLSGIVGIHRQQGDLISPLKFFSKQGEWVKKEPSV